MEFTSTASQWGGFNFALKKWHQSGFANTLKKRRFDYFMQLASPSVANLESVRLLDLGCANGKDLLRYLFDDSRFELHGIDVEDHDVREQNFQFHHIDAEQTHFPDDHFDITVSMGVLEHIQPIEKLCRVISEIRRISKSYYILVPSIATMLEPHTGAIRWQLKDHNRKKPYSHLNYFSDEAWLQFEGFKGATTKRRSYIPLVKQDLWIYRHAA
jgi:hypothetical protein